MEDSEADAGRRKKQKLDAAARESSGEGMVGSEEAAGAVNGGRPKVHFVLIHGPCFGGWVWYKVATQLRSAGHRVSAPDLAGCGADPTRLEDLRSFEDHAAPLMRALASIPPEEKIVAVGHGFGGLALSLAMERFPGRITAAVFLAALMPKKWSAPAATLDEFYQRDHIESLMDCKFDFDQVQESPLKSFIYGPEFMEKMMLNCCLAEDFTLATMLVRPGALYLEDISNEKMLSEENYGSVNRVYIICKQDKMYDEDYQRWIVDSNPPNEVKEIQGSDHLVMLSKPHELCQCLQEIADR